MTCVDRATRHYTGWAVALFVYAWNRRLAFKRQYPKMPAHVRDFVADLI